MSTQDIIESGTVELFVYGCLPADTQAEVAQQALSDPKLTREIEAIEQSVLALSSSFAPPLRSSVYLRIQRQLLGDNRTSQPLVRRLIPYWGWAASVALLIGFFVQYQRQQSTQQQLRESAQQQQQWQAQYRMAQQSNAAKAQYIQALQAEGAQLIRLSGQSIAPGAQATIVLNARENKVYVDVSGLPKPPQGKVYQVWSLQLDPLTPTSIGVLDPAASQQPQLTALQNTPHPQAFGITLEPEGGSPAPTLEQLYVLGKV